MLDPHEWEWLEEHAEGDFDHLLIGTSLPLLLAPGAALPGVLERGGLQRRMGQAGGACVGEQVRQALDLEHWAAFGSSLERVIAARPRRRHGREGHAAGHDRRALGRRAPRVPRRGRLPARDAGCARRSTRRRARRSATRSTTTSGARSASPAAAPGTLVGKLLARAAGVGDPPVRWRFTHDEPFFDNQVCFLELDGRRARLWLQKTVPEENEGYSLETVFERVIA